VADYSPTTWVDDDGSGTVGTPFTAARMNGLEAGVKDAAQDSKQRGAVASRPAAAAGNKNWIWTDSTTGQMSYSTGSAWVDIGQPKNQAQVATTLTPTVRQFGGTATSTFRAWGGAAGSRRLIAQKITVGSAGAYTLHRVKFELQRLGATAGTIQCDIRADSSGVPGTTLATAQTKFLAPDLADGPSGLTNGDFIFNGLALATRDDATGSCAVSNLSGTGQWGVGIAGGTPPGKYAERTSGVWTVTNTKSLRHAVILNNETVVDASAETADSVLRAESRPPVSHRSASRAARTPDALASWDAHRRRAESRACPRGDRRAWQLRWL
jgi:hypothetical protein